MPAEQHSVEEKGCRRDLEIVGILVSPGGCAKEREKSDSAPPGFFIFCAAVP